MLIRQLIIFATGFWSIIACASIKNENPVVCLKKDYCIRGTSFEGNLKPFEGFLGIPFAKPPVNELRLKDPVPLDESDLTGTYNATEPKMFCIQKNYLMPNPVVMGVEDCLHLYVYRPKAPLRLKNRLLPVIVYIHGGGFFAGTAAPMLTGPDFFMDSEDVIFVAMNYRLGPLGFLSTGDKHMSGNFGLKDQAMAIAWTKENIKKFGGDDENITLMGQSAGAASVHLHMMSSPKWSRNMFHRSVIVSGNGNAPYAYVIENPIDQAREFAKFSNIKNSENLNSQALAKKLRSADPADLINACDHMRYWSVDPVTISRPVVENCSETEGFLCADPFDLWREGKHRKVPILSGFMDGDGGVRALAVLENKTDYNDLNMRFSDVIPMIMEVVDQKRSNVTQMRTEMINKKYFDGKGVVRNDTDTFVRLYTDRAFITPLYNMMQQLVKNDQKTPAYMYKFSYRGSLTYANFYTGTATPSPILPVHCDELVYLLSSPLLFANHQKFDENSVEGQFRKKIVNFFTSFAATGVAQVHGKPLNQCRYSQNSKLKCQYVEFNNRKDSIGELDHKTVDFWNRMDDKVLKAIAKEEKASQIEVKQIFKRDDSAQSLTLEMSER